MYIEQAQSSRNNLLLYLPIPLGIGFLMVVNYIFSKGIDTTEMIHQYIDLFGTNLTFVLLIAPLSIGCLVVLFWTKLVHGQSITSLTTSRKSIDWKRILFSFSLWSFLTIALFFVGYLLEPQDYKWNFNLQKFLPFLIIAIILIPLQTSFEEYLFRGYAMQGLGLATNSRMVPFLVTSVLFGLMHIANPEVEKLGPIIMVYYIGTGFFLGILTLMDEGLELALGFHAANNLVGALLITSDWGAFQTHSIFKDFSEPSTSYEIFIPIILIYPLLLWFFSKKYKWNNWKDKLFGKLNFNNTPVYE